MALLDSYSGPWGREQAAHLARRAGFGDEPDEIDTLVDMGMDVAVDSADCKNHFCFRSDRLSLSPPAQKVRWAGYLKSIVTNRSLRTARESVLNISILVGNKTPFFFIFI